MSALRDLLMALMASENPQPAGKRPMQPTPARPFNERGFQDWYEEMSKRFTLAPDPDTPDQYYDYRAAYSAGASPDATQHWPSDFKRPGHPNLVVGGFHVQTGERVPGTRQGTVQELIDLGWDQTFAQRNGRR